MQIFFLFLLSAISDWAMGEISEQVSKVLLVYTVIVLGLENRGAIKICKMFVSFLSTIY